MFKNYLKIAVRTLWRSKGYAFINVMGLAIAITGATLLLSYVKNETSHDTFHAKSERTHRIIATQKNLDEPRKFASNPGIFAQTLNEEIPEIVSSTTLYRRGGHWNFIIDGVRFAQRSYFIIEPSFFEVFDFELISGDPATVVSEPNAIVVTEREAIRYFGSTDVIGNVLQVPGIGEAKVTGVIKNPPPNSHIQFELLVSAFFTDNGWKNATTSWNAFGSASYIVLAPGSDANAVAAKAEALANERMGAPLADIVDFSLQPIEEIHFNSADIESGIEETKGDKSYIFIFLSITVFLLLIASVNYMNLATSRAVFRAKEIGIRKVVGAVKRQLVMQFLLESLMITFLSLLISIGLTDLIMPFFNEVTGKNFDFSWSTLGEFLPLLGGVALLVGVLSGIYPSFFMTRFKTVDVLKGESKTGSSFSLRKVLVVVQFALAIFMIISTLVVSDQMNFIKEKNLGFNEENLMVIDINNGRVRREFKTMRAEFAKIPGVQSVGVSTRVPGEWKGINEVQANLFSGEGQVRDSVTLFYMGFDEGMLETFDFKIKDGKYFMGNDDTDMTKILVNEAAAEAFGYPDNAVGQTVQLTARGQFLSTQIIGVLEDFNFQSLHNKVEPMIIGYWNNPAASIDYFTLKVSGNMSDVIEGATQVHNQFDQSTAMEYHFLESQLDLFYEDEIRASIIFKVGSGLSIFVACLGLFGLASFTVEKRVKEMGIRKVLGASQWNLFYLLSSTFTKQVIISFLLACPFAYWLMSGWLRGFEYQVGIGVWTFLVAGLTSVAVALLTVSYRSLKAANSNPVSSLRNE
jgi:putative ABC transport system permease protein